MHNSAYTHYKNYYLHVNLKNAGKENILKEIFTISMKSRATNRYRKILVHLFKRRKPEWWRFCCCYRHCRSIVSHKLIHFKSLEVTEKHLCDKPLSKFVFCYKFFFVEYQVTWFKCRFKSNLFRSKNESVMTFF